MAKYGVYASLCDSDNICVWERGTVHVGACVCGSVRVGACVVLFGASVSVI